MANTEKSGFFSRKRPKTREEVRKSLTLVQGGKAGSPVWLDNRNMQEDQFLREHYLDRNYTFGILPEAGSGYHRDEET